MSARPAPRLVAGLDLGSTGLKLLVADENGNEVLTEQVRTPWRPGARGTTEIVATDLIAAVLGLINAAARRLAEDGDARVAAVGLAGMGESGMLVDDTGAAVGPAYAWFDPRGGDAAAAFPAAVRAEFAGRTGLPLGAQVSVAKLAYLRDRGQRLAGLRWLNLPEFVAASLGGDVVVEHSLISRTGLIDQDTGEPWPAVLNLLGVDETFLPPRVQAGTLVGRVAGGVPRSFHGAALTIAGHDHLVAAEASGALRQDQYHVSLGTAEVLLRVIDAPLGFDARARLAGQLINTVRHIVPGKQVLVAGVKTGLLLRRVLQLVGIEDRAGRDRLDEAVMALTHEGGLAAGAIEVGGARNDDGVLGLTIRSDGVTPAELFAAVLRHSNDEIDLLTGAIDQELEPARSATLTGGWSGMASVRRARSRVLPPLTATSREHETAYGAAQAAARLLPPVETELARATTSALTTASEGTT